MSECKHEWVFRENCYSEQYGNYVTEWEKRSVYYCKFCMEEKETVKYDQSRERPYWYKGNNK